ncbi:tRNA lysidine(34) synthetase TilS [Dehalococcoidia bacterium]|nr:tRNA lysidine(34) synthetase TilS [Dehalococcoidia bacterium]
MLNRVKQLILSSGLENSTLIAATSGGADSIAMLHILSQISDEMGLELIGAHLNHKIRGSESDLDEEFVVSVFEHLGLVYEIGSVDIPKLSIEEKKSIEDVARTERLKFFYRTSRKYQASAICLGHNANDHTETVLMHIVRGSGIKGLRGMQPVSTLPMEGRLLTLFRPLIEQFRIDIEEYCTLKDLRFVTDSTNEMDQYTRNHFRLSIIPSLLQVNPSLHNAISRLSTAAIADNEFIDQISEKVWNSHASFSNNTVEIDTDQLASLHKSVQHRFLVRAVSAISGNSSDISMAHTTSFSCLVTGPSGKTLTLPGSILVKKQYEGILIYKAENNHIDKPQFGATEITIPGITRIKGWEIRSHIWPIGTDKILSKSDKFVAYFNEGILDNKVFVRTRVNGDRFQPIGMHNSKKVQDFMVDEKIPKDLRNQIPLVVSSAGICWIVGHRISEWAKREEANNTVAIQFIQTED